MCNCSTDDYCDRGSNALSLLILLFILPLLCGRVNETSAAPDASLHQAIIRKRRGQMGSCDADLSKSQGQAERMWV